MTDDWDDINVNRKKGDRVNFESTLFQQIYDGIDFIREESKDILKELDASGFKKNFDGFVVEELGENALNQISDIAEGVSELKSEIIDSNNLPEFIKGYSIDAKKALNRDEDYVRRAQRRLDKLDSDELVNVYKTNIRVVELCDKAIEVNSSNADAYYLKGRALSNLDKYPEAIEEFVNSLAINDDVKVWIAIANTNTLNGDYEDAINVYDNVLEKEENNFDAIKGKALTYFASGDFKKADEEFKKAADIGTLDEASKEIWDECIKD